MGSNDAPPKSRWRWLLSCDNGTMWPNPQRVAEVEHELRYGSPRSVRFLAATVCEAYLHLVAHPAGTEAVVQSLRSVRRAVILEQLASGGATGRRCEGRADEDLEVLEDLEQLAAGGALRALRRGAR